MIRLIDADALKEWLQILPNASYTDMVLNTIDDLPTVDAVPVIRCKDCRFHRGKYCTAWGDGSVAVSCETDADGFCAWAERKVTEHD